MKKQYKKPQIIAKNNPTGSYAAGCPAELRGGTGGTSNCDQCDRVA